MDAAASDAWLSAGRIGRAHGLDGSFYVTRPRIDAFVVGEPIRVGDVETTIVRSSGTPAKPIVRVATIVGREAVDALRETDLFVPRGAAPVLGDDEYLAEDLEGCAVVDGEVAVGTVRTLLGLPSCDVLEVERPGGSDLLVPLVHDAVRSIDVAARRIEIDLAFLGEAG